MAIKIIFDDWIKIKILQVYGDDECIIGCACENGLVKETNDPFSPCVSILQVRFAENN